MSDRLKLALPADRRSTLARTGNFWSIAMLALVMALQVTLVFNRAINWDEFWHYSLVNKLAAGTLTDPLQTLFTRAFTWVLALPGNGVDHIVIIRLFMLGCEFVTLVAIIGIASRFFDRTTGWLCALAYAGGGYVFQHATSFRFDGPATAMLMAAAWILLRAPLRPVTLFAVGALLGTAGMFTIKSGLYAPVFAGIAWLRWSEAGRSPAAALRLVAVGVVAAASFGVIYLLHAGSLAGDSGAAAQRVANVAGTRMFTLGAQPYWPLHVRGAALAPLLTLLALTVPALLAIKPRPLPERIALLGLWLPLTTLLFYHNTAPYYFVFMLAPVAAACAVPMSLAMRRYSPTIIALALGALGATVWLMETPSPIVKQRTLIDTANRLFPDKPAYFDSNAMLGTFPKANAFMTPWGTELYLAGAVPSMTETAAAIPVPLIVNDDYMFADALTTRNPVHSFLPQDLAMLRGSYVQFWGPFWVAGFDLSPSAAARDIVVTVPGTYTLNSPADVAIDGTVRRPGEIFELQRGRHRIGSLTAPLRLLWGRNLRVPAQPAPPEPYFMPF